jgi:hypothetical protein
MLALDLNLLGQDDHRLLANLLQAHACARAMLLARTSRIDTFVSDTVLGRHPPSADDAES